jgi:hypothetical protein
METLRQNNKNIPQLLDLGFSQDCYLSKEMEIQLRKFERVVLRTVGIRKIAWKVTSPQVNMSLELKVKMDGPAN